MDHGCSHRCCPDYILGRLAMMQFFLCLLGGIVLYEVVAGDDDFDFGIKLAIMLAIVVGGVLGYFAMGSLIHFLS